MSGEPRPKIIVDDDWKTRVQAEREALVKQEQGDPKAAEAPAKSESPPSETPRSETPPSESSRNAPERYQLPSPSFPLLLSTLATEALAGLGQLRGPDNQPTPVDLEHAKHFIDTLAMLEEKTKGNLTMEEAAMLENALHELRLAYVAISARGT